MNTIGGLQNTPRRGVDVTMISGLKNVANFTRWMSKEPDKVCRRFLKASTTCLPPRIRRQNMVPRETRTITTTSRNPPKRRRLAYETTTPVPIPSTSRDVVYETPTPQSLSKETMMMTERRRPASRSPRARLRCDECGRLG